MKDNNASRNVYNVTEIESFLDQKARGKLSNYQNWLRSILRNYMIREYPVRQVLPMSMRAMASMFSTMLSSALGKAPQKLLNIGDLFVFVRDSESPVWAKKAFAEGESIVSIVFDEEKLSDEIDHWHDYVRSDLAEKNLMRITVPEMEKQTKAWVERLRKEKILADDLLQTTVVWSNESYKLVSLDTKAAYALEGQRMHHCVKSYWQDLPKNDPNRRPYTIYSLRLLNNDPLVTVEAWPYTHSSKGSLKSFATRTIKPLQAQSSNFLVLYQLRAALDKRPSEDLKLLIIKALAEVFPNRKIVLERDLDSRQQNGFRSFYHSFSNGDEDEEDEDEEYEENEDDDETEDTKCEDEEDCQTYDYD